jgi:hypothetical protein
MIWHVDTGRDTDAVVGDRAGFPGFVSWSLHSALRYTLFVHTPDWLLPPAMRRAPILTWLRACPLAAITVTRPLHQGATASCSSLSGVLLGSLGWCPWITAIPRLRSGPGSHPSARMYAYPLPSSVSPSQLYVSLFPLSFCSRPRLVCIPHPSRQLHLRRTPLPIPAHSGKE